MSGLIVSHLIQKIDDFKILPEFSSSDGEYRRSLIIEGQSLIKSSRKP